MRAVSVPAHIVLPAASGGLVPIGAVWRAMGVSRQWGSMLRRNHGFPAASGGMVDIVRVGAWLTERGARIAWA